MIIFESLIPYERRIKKYLEQNSDDACKDLIGTLYSTLNERLVAAINHAIDNGNCKRVRELEADMAQTLELLIRGIDNKIDLEVLHLLERVTFLDVVEDNRVLDAVNRNSLTLKTAVYLEEMHGLEGNHNFATPVFEDGNYYMLSFNERGEVINKELVMPVRVIMPDNTIVYEMATINGSYYKPLDIAFPKEMMKEPHKFKDYWDNEDCIVIGEHRVPYENYGTILSNYIYVKNGQILSCPCSRLLKTAMYFESYEKEAEELSSKHPEYTDYDYIRKTIETEMSTNLANYLGTTRK